MNSKISKKSNLAVPRICDFWLLIGGRVISMGLLCGQGFRLFGHNLNPCERLAPTCEKWPMVLKPSSWMVRQRILSHPSIPCPSPTWHACTTHLFQYVYSLGSTKSNWLTRYLFLKDNQFRTMLCPFNCQSLFPKAILLSSLFKIDLSISDHLNTT